MQWNIHHGIGTDGVLDPWRIASWIAYVGPNVVSLNEVDTPELAGQIHAGLEAQTGQTWTAWYSGKGTMLLTRLAVQANSVCTTNAASGSYAAHLSLLANGRTVNVWSTHLSVNSAGERVAELYALQACAGQWPEARVLAGDFNMQASSGEYAIAASAYVDAWALARANGATINFSGNCDGCTRNSRIDNIYASQGASRLSLQYAQVFDIRDGNGIMASDHKPILAVYAVN
jgi:endonuclease/exonuclease/phosphatase family metal-dependent hydrolase